MCACHGVKTVNLSGALREKCPDTEFFLVCIFVNLRKSPYSVQMQENTDQKKLRIWTLFTEPRFCVRTKWMWMISYTNAALTGSKLK